MRSTFLPFLLNFLPFFFLSLPISSMVLHFLFSVSHPFTVHFPVFSPFPVSSWKYAIVSDPRLQSFVFRGGPVILDQDRSTPSSISKYRVYLFFAGGRRSLLLLRGVFDGSSALELAFVWLDGFAALRVAPLTFGWLGVSGGSAV